MTAAPDQEESERSEEMIVFESVDDVENAEIFSEKSSTNSEAINSEDGSERTAKNEYFINLFGPDYNRTEVKYVLFAACLIALNCGFVNGVTMSGYLIVAESTPGDGKTQMVAGFAGAFTNTAITLVKHEGVTYRFNLYMILSYMIGAFIAAIISPRATSYVIEPRYGPTFMVGGTMLLAASLLTSFDYDSQYVFLLVTASNGVQNGIASIYSANLIRCTLTGAITDIAIVIAQCIHGNTKGLARGMVISAIVLFFWIGGIIGFAIVRKLTVFTLLINAFLFYSVGITLVFYLVKELGVSVFDAIFGTWKWKNALKKLDTEDGDLTEDKMMNLFDEIDAKCIQDNKIDADELMAGMRNSRINLTDYSLRYLMRAADEDGDGVISREEWQILAKKVL